MAASSLTFLPHLHVLADGDVFTPRLLDDPSKTVILSLPHLLQEEELQTTDRKNENQTRTRTLADRMVEESELVL